jgi:hypothetical protein
MVGTGEGREEIEGEKRVKREKGLVNSYLTVNFLKNCHRNLKNSQHESCT